MKAKCICNRNKEYLITLNDAYVIFGGKCLKVNDEQTIISIWIQDDTGNIGIYNINDFEIQSITFERYVFVSENQNEFLNNCISYDGFWVGFYNDNPDGLNGYLKAKKAFLSAKMELYREYSECELQAKISSNNLDERDFIFSFLRNEKNSNFIELAIALIKDSMKNNSKYFEVDEIFRYLSSFKNECIQDFFIEYMSNEIWENSEINEIVYNYF